MQPIRKNNPKPFVCIFCLREIEFSSVMYEAPSYELYIFLHSASTYFCDHYLDFQLDYRKNKSCVCSYCADAIIYDPQATIVKHKLGIL